MSTLDEIQNYVIAQSPEWDSTNCFTTRQPDEPDKCLTFYEYAGVPAYMVGQNNASYENVRVQARVRDTTYDGARNSLLALRTLLNAASGSLGGIQYYKIQCYDTPTSLEPDSQDRESLVLNFLIMKEPS